MKRKRPGRAAFFLISFVWCAGWTLSSQPSLADDEVSPEPAPAEPPSMILNVSAKKNAVENTAQVSRTEVTHQQIQKDPLGDQISLPKLLESTSPSVVYGGYGRFYTRQSENGLQYQVDGIELPDLPDNAIGSLFNPRNIERVEVILGALPADYGDRPSGVLNIVTPEGGEQPSGSVEVNYGSYDTFSPQAEASGSSGDSTFNYFLTANYHQTNRGLDTPQPVSYFDEGQGTADAVHDSAHGNNELARLDFALDNEDRLTLLLSNQDDFYQIPNFPASYSPTDPLFGQNDGYGNDPLNYTPPDTNDSQTETSAFTEAAWTHTFSKRSFLRVGSFYKYYKILVQNDPENDLAAILDPTLTNNPDPSNASLYENRHTSSEGVKADYKLRTSDENAVQAGMNLKAYQTSGVASVIGANPYSGGPTLLSSTDSSPEYGYIEGIYAQDEWTLSQRWFMNAGLRFDSFQANYLDAKPVYYQLQPRILLSFMASQGTKFHAFYGRLFNVPLFEDLHDTFASLAGQAGQTITPYDIKPETDNYYEVGVDQQIGQHVASLTTYYKQATNLLDDAQLLNTALQQPFNWAQGYAYGVELALHGELAAHWSDYFNYSYGIAKGSGISGGLFAIPQPPTGGYQLLDHVQKHTASAGMTYTDRGYWATLVAKYGSGLPTGPNNSENAPGHSSWDTSLGYEILNSQSWMNQMKFSLDVLNIFDNRYAIFIANGFNGSYYAAGREWMGHVSKDF